MKLVKLINAASAITKIAQSGDLPASYVWDILDFVEAARVETKKFDTVRTKIIEDNTIEKDGEPMIEVAGYNADLDVLFDKEIELDCSILDLDKIKKVEGVSAIEVIAIKELLEG